MIIIKIIILYFIQIRHTDDFPSTGTRLALAKFRIDHDPSPYYLCQRQQVLVVMFDRS